MVMTLLPAIFLGYEINHFLEEIFGLVGSWYSHLTTINYAVVLTGGFVIPSHVGFGIAT